jgi:hypothetical protein
LNITDLRLLALPRKSGALAVNRNKDTDKSIGNPFFEGKREAAPSFIVMILLEKH